MLRLLASLVITGGTLLAAELPPLDLGRLSQKQFNQLLSKSMSNMDRLQLLNRGMRPFTPAAQTCSIPLREIRSQSSAPNPGVIRAGSGKFDPIAKPAGPVCQNWLPKK